MNYYERHIGDFIKDTLGLSMLEDGAYNRLLDQVYQTERPLPCDKKEIYRNARATTAAERKAVDYVLTKFFDLGPDGYMQKRAQAVLEEYWDREPAEQNKRENAKIRQQRARERRKQLFEQLRKLGVTPEFNASMKHLEAELSRVTKREENDDSHAHVTRDDTATQTPNTKHQEIHTDADASKKYSMRQDLLDRGIPEQLVKDWLECRKAKKLANTLTALDGVASEAEKAGKSLEDVLRICCKEGWGGFKAKWLTHDPNSLDLPVWEH